MKKILALVGLIVGSLSAQAQVDSVTVDLRESWLMWADGKFSPHNGAGTVAFIQLSELDSGVIKVSAPKPFDILINNKLAASKTRQFKKEISGKASGGTLTIFSSTNLNDVSAVLTKVQTENIWARRPATVSSALILISFFLLLALVALIYYNPPAALEYFNVYRIFSPRSFDDSALTIRITSANNIFYYLFCAVLVGVHVFIFYCGKTIFSLSGGEIALKIILYSALVFSAMAAKIVTISALAGLFKLTDFGPTQFHYYVRLILCSFLFCSLVLALLVMFNGNWMAWMLRLHYFIVGLSIVFVGTIFLKLLARGGFTVFHLFSYLCASEIIPLIVLLNVYYS